MAKTKAVNYTPEMVATIVSIYTAAGTETGALADAGRDAALEALVLETGRTKKSLVAKLVAEGVYIKKGYVTKTGGRPETKSQIVVSLASIMGMDPETQLSGLDTATVSALKNVRAFILDLAATVEAGAEHALACEQVIVDAGLIVPDGEATATS